MTTARTLPALALAGLAVLLLAAVAAPRPAAANGARCAGAIDPKADACCDARGCVSGRWGSCGCDYSCPDRCARGCDRVTGECTASLAPKAPTDHLAGRVDSISEMLGNAHSHFKAECVQPAGEDCSWYDKCLKPGLADKCPLIDDLMDRKCREFRDSEGGLSENGRKWSAYIRRCIQLTMGDKLLRDFGKHTCAEASAMFFAEHHPCYLEGPVSFCDLPALDQASIIARAGVEVFSSSVVDVTTMGTGLLASCAAEYVDTAVDSAQDAGAGLVEGLRSLFGLDVAVRKIEGSDKLVVVVKGQNVKHASVREAIDAMRHKHPVLNRLPSVLRSNTGQPVRSASIDHKNRRVSGGEDHHLGPRRVTA